MFYYEKSQGSYAFKFKPSETVTSVKVYNPSFKGTDFDTPGITGFTAVDGTNDGGVWTVTLTEGRNIVEMSDGTNTRYQVLTAMPVQIFVNGKDYADTD